PRLLPEARLRHARRVCDVIPRARHGRLVPLVRKAVQGGEIVAAPPERLLPMLEVPEVEEVAARQEPLVAEEGEELLTDEQPAETGLRLVKLRLLAEMVEERVVVERGQERAAQRRRGGDVLRAPEPRLELEEETENVGEQRVEVRHERPAVLRELRERGRLR